MTALQSYRAVVLQATFVGSHSRGSEETVVAALEKSDCGLCLWRPTRVVRSLASRRGIFRAFPLLEWESPTHQLSQIRVLAEPIDLNGCNIVDCTMNLPNVDCGMWTAESTISRLRNVDCGIYDK